MKETTDKWLNDYDVIKRLVHTISETLNNRNKLTKSSAQYIKLTASIRGLLGKLNSSILNLSKGLDENLENGSITQHEYARRCGLINQLKTNEKLFETSLREDMNRQRDFLIDFSENGREPVLENEFTENVSNQQLLAHHDRLILDQDRGLDTLSHIVRNQKQIASTIGTEIDKQNSMIDTIGDKMDNVNERLIKETKHVRVVSAKASTCGLWLLIVLLFIAIIVIVSIPKPK